MPYSGAFCDHIVRRAFQGVSDLHSFLDIGAGNGKYGQIIREDHPECHTIGLEIEADYIFQFRLDTIYNEIWNMDAMGLLKNPDVGWDFVMLGDVIEHLPKSDGLDLIHFLAYRSRYMVVVYPDAMQQNSWEGYKAEAHLSLWQPADFDPIPHVAIHEAHKTVVCLDGLMKHQPSFEEIFK